MRGNKNAVTTGEHEAIWMDTLDEKERELFHTIKTDPLEQINNEIRFLELRERRMMIRIQEIQRGTESKSTDRKFQRVESKKGVRMMEVERNEKERAKLERILSIEDALTRVQDKKTKLLELKNKLTTEDEEKKVRTAILQIELQQLQGGAGATQSWTYALKEIAERRKAKRAEQAAVKGDE